MTEEGFRPGKGGELPSIRKDPAADLDYSIDLRALGWLREDETLVSAEWVVPAGLTKRDPSNDDDAATVWLTGGTAGTDYTVSCTFETSTPRIDKRSFIVRCRDR